MGSLIFHGVKTFLQAAAPAAVGCIGALVVGAGAKAGADAIAKAAKKSDEKK